ncbi:hypothetical protein FOPE_10791 [Fonsecaea pedrosoi]|nr:hypothetical protein FOPE_10791 [Fonsecaea pedrosoi]
MCHQFNPRHAPAGDLVAILHRIQDDNRNRTAGNACWCRLLLSKSCGSEIVGELRCEEPTQADKLQGQKLHVTIWTYANEHIHAAPARKQRVPNPVFARFPLVTGAGPTIVSRASRDTDGRDECGRRDFDLTVDERGIVGREVDVTNEQGQVLGRGIIGWN